MHQSVSTKHHKAKNITSRIKARFHYWSIIIVLFLLSVQSQAQVGTWLPVLAQCPNKAVGVMLLLSDGSVIVKTNFGDTDFYGNVWNKLTPDIHGSYINGTWSTIAPMRDTRLYFSSQLLNDGRVYVAGGEYGSGKNNSEVYDPLTDVWTKGPTSFIQISDANSELLPDGTVLQAIVGSGSTGNKIYDPIANTYSSAAYCIGNHDEASWLKLPDNSILLTDNYTLKTERYIPALKTWIADSSTPVNLFDILGHETGASFLLPDGRGFFIGNAGKTLYYNPSGTTSKGFWTLGPNLPDSMGATDAAAAMMVNGKILCAFAPVPIDSHIYRSPTYFYEFDYRSNKFTQILAPTGDSFIKTPCYYTNMLDLPDGTVLFSNQYDSQLYVYKPFGPELASGKPTINNIAKIDCNNYTITGTLFNGISEGAGYGDDWQMATNYPIVRLTSGANVYYARTSHWNSNGIQRGPSPDTAHFILPAGLPNDTYSLTLSANGISSAPYTFKTCGLGVEETTLANKQFLIYPNPAKDKVTISGAGTIDELKITDVLGQLIYQAQPKSNITSVAMLQSGIYFITIVNVIII